MNGGLRSFFESTVVDYDDVPNLKNLSDKISQWDGECLRSIRINNIADGDYLAFPAVRDRGNNQSINAIWLASYNIGYPNNYNTNNLQVYPSKRVLVLVHTNKMYEVRIHGFNACLKIIYPVFKEYVLFIRKEDGTIFGNIFDFGGGNIFTPVSLSDYNIDIRDLVRYNVNGVMFYIHVGIDNSLYDEYFLLPYLSGLPVSLELYALMRHFRIENKAFNFEFYNKRFLESVDVLPVEDDEDGVVLPPPVQGNVILQTVDVNEFLDSSDSDVSESVDSENVPDTVLTWYIFEKFVENLSYHEENDEEKAYVLETIFDFIKEYEYYDPELEKLQLGNEDDKYIYDNILTQISKPYRLS
jgi:hypothetical protein